MTYLQSFAFEMVQGIFTSSVDQDSTQSMQESVGLMDTLGIHFMCHLITSL